MPSDVAIYVEHGAADVGIVGKDILTEASADVYELLDTGLGKCRMCVAAPADYQDDPSRPVRVATKFVNVDVYKRQRNLFAKGSPDRGAGAKRLRGLFVSNRHTAGVGVQTLPLGKIGNAGGNLAQRLPGVVKKAGFLDEVVHAQGAGEAGGAAGGQGVVGACEVIPQRLGHVAAQEDAARVLDLVQHAERVFHTDFQMLGCNDVAGLNRCV